jgi:hypothetical protein
MTGTEQSDPQYNGPRLVFLDTETTGLDEHYDMPWEVSWINRDLTGVREDIETSVFVQHNTERAEKLPEPFRTDYLKRYKADEAISKARLADMLGLVFQGRPHLIGAVPGFDTVRLTQILAGQFRLPPWHYHVIDVENVALGFLIGKLSDEYVSFGVKQAIRETVFRLTSHGKSIRHDDLALLLGVDVDLYDRHTSLGDCRLVRDEWDAMTANPNKGGSWLRS